MTTGPTAEIERGPQSAATSPSLPLLAEHYAAIGETLGHFATVRSENVRLELQSSRTMDRLLSDQRRTLEMAADRTAYSIEDMIAKLEIWRAEVIDCEDENIRSTDRLVLSVLEALKRHF